MTANVGAQPTSTLSQILELIDGRLAEIEDLALAPERELPPAPELPAEVGAIPADLQRAQELLDDVRAAEARIVGLRRRIAGEIAGLKRPARAPRFTAPRLIDTVI